jgi:hypothetical protein
MSSGGVANKISRGGFSSAFLLQCMHALGLVVQPTEKPTLEVNPVENAGQKDLVTTMSIRNFKLLIMAQICDAMINSLLTANALSIALRA